MACHPVEFFSCEMSDFSRRARKRTQDQSSIDRSDYYEQVGSQRSYKKDKGHVDEISAPIAVIEQPVSTTSTTVSRADTSMSGLIAAARQERDRESALEQESDDVMLAPLRKHEGMKRGPPLDIFGPAPRKVGRLSVPESGQTEDRQLLDFAEANAEAIEMLATLDKKYPNRKQYIHTRDMDIQDNQNCTSVSGLAAGTGDDQRIGNQVDWISVHVRGFIFPNFNRPTPICYQDRVDVYLIWDKATSATDIGAASFTSTGSTAYPLPTLLRDRFEVIAHQSYALGSWSVIAGATPADAVFHGAGAPCRLVEMHKSLVGRRTNYKGSGDLLTDIESGVLWFVVVGFWDIPAGPGSEYWSFYGHIKVEYVG